MKVYSTLKKSDPLHENYRKILDVSLVIVLLIFIFSALGFQRLNKVKQIKLDIPVVITTICTPPITIFDEPKEPSGPQIPVESENDELVEDDPLSENMFVWDSVATINKEPVDPTENLPIPIYKVERRPKLLQFVTPVYPDLARKTEMEGRVWVNIVVDENGNVSSAHIQKSNPVFDQAAIDAVMQFKFSPAVQNKKYVKVSMRIPIDFKLK